MKAHQLRSNRKAENTITKLNHIKARGRTPNGGLENLTNRKGAKPKLAVTKRGNQEERNTKRANRRNREAKLLLNRRLNTMARTKAETRESHDLVEGAYRRRSTAIDVDQETTW